MLFRSDDTNPLGEAEFADKVTLLSEMDAYARGRDPRVRQVSVSLSGQWQAVQIIRPGGQRVCDVRPLVRLNVTVVVEKNGRMETGSHGVGGRVTYDRYLDPDNWKAAVDEALRQALVNLESVAAPAGEVPVVLGPGWPGILLHEAIGHGLEGDFNRKKTSAFAGLLGERVAAPGVTVIDDGTMDDRRGSLTIDDEGTPSQRTVLIEDGILKGYMQDRMNARLMGKASTGNGRRESYANAPIPRMTNTYMLDGEHDPEEILKSVNNGIYAANFGGGQVDLKPDMIRIGHLGDVDLVGLLGTVATLERVLRDLGDELQLGERKGTRLNSSHKPMSDAVFCLKKKNSGWCEEEG